MLKPDLIKKGDRIAIVSTARKIAKNEINEAIHILKTWGLLPIIGHSIGLEYNQFAGTEEERSLDFQEMLDDDEIKAIWCARGGYGTVRIIDMLDFYNFRKNPKWIIGYSDITVLHSHIHNFNISSIHAAMPVDIHKGTEETRHSLKNILFGKEVVYSIPSSPENVLGTGKGQLIGGNLSILYSLCGSASSIITKGKILCIEDLDEYLYHMDRMLQNLKRNRFFEELSGLIVGGMTQMHDNNVSFGQNAKEIILAIVREYKFPVVFDFPMGHIEDNRALLFGAEVSLSVNEKETVLSYI